MAKKPYESMRYKVDRFLIDGDRFLIDGLSTDQGANVRFPDVLLTFGPSKPGRTVY